MRRAKGKQDYGNSACILLKRTKPAFFLLRQRQVDNKRAYRANNLPTFRTDASLTTETDSQLTYRRSKGLY